MQEYNTQRPSVHLPEYGRNIQDLVNYCKTIPNRDRRNACARTIVNIMGDIYPDLAEVSGCKNILWDHLAVISNFELDIDYPCEVMKAEEVASRPNPIQNHQSYIQRRMYGKISEGMVQAASKLENPEEAQRLLELVANQMKRNFHQTYKDADEEDNVILEDLSHIAAPQFQQEIRQLTLQGAKELQVNNQYDPACLQVTTKKKKKKKK